ncbi:MAG: fumarate reductase cytochrome b subunit [Myxococcota bacterium]
MNMALQKPRKSRVPARLDLAQSLTGLALALFTWAHLFLVSSILLGEEAMYVVAKTMELAFLSPTGHGYPAAVAMVGVVVSVLFVVHAGLAMRKLPANWKQVVEYRSHLAMMRHGDTRQWWVQAVTGFAMFFLASVHLYVITTNPALIGPYESADRVYGFMWPLYAALLVSVEAHAAIGTYRLAMKWGIPGGVPRARMQLLAKAMTGCFLTLGAATLLAYLKLGYEHRDHAGERYVPAEHR